MWLGTVFSGQAWITLAKNVLGEILAKIGIPTKHAAWQPIHEELTCCMPLGLLSTTSYHYSAEN